MKDDKKFKIFSIISTVLVICILSYSIFQEYLATELGGYLKRRLYYEKVILKKGLTLHEGKYWKKVEE
jgi:hypothetical protein